MRIFEVESADEYQWLTLVDPDDFELFWAMGMGDPYPERESVEVFIVPETAHLLSCDCPYLMPGVIAFKASAFSLIQSLIEGRGKVQTLTLGTDVYYAVIAEEIDALDEEHTSFIRFEGDIVGIYRYEFRGDRLQGATAFRILQNERVYATETFVERIREHGITGLDFRLVWEREG